MKGEAQPLIKYFDGSDKRFIIPLYQRNYDWKIDNCKQLFQDLMTLHNSNRKSHFFGSIVSSIKAGSEDRFIIDGQQRITTVSLMLIAMVNGYKEGLLEADDKKLVEKIFKRYLVDEYQEEERKVKLKPIKKDMQAFDALLYLPKEKYIKESNVTRNYDFFYDEIQKCGLKLDDLFDCIKKLEVINIKLEEGDDAQLIFESLNSTGLDLSEADKIRNYLLMSLTPDEQDQLYTKYWNPIEESTDYDPTPFVRDYLTMKQRKIGRLDKIYFIFKEYADNNSIARKDLLADMYHYARIYRQIDKCDIGVERLNLKLSQLKTLDSTIAYPFYLAFFDYAEETQMQDAEKFQVLDIIEAYWARRIICNLPSNALNKVFATLHKDVTTLISKNIQPDGSKPSYISVLTYILLKKARSSVFPLDEEVKSDFAVRQVYKMPAPLRMFIIERLENQDNNERHDVVKLLSEKNISIEHIMPQTLSDEWKESLGKKWETIHQQYLHTMANLTLTGYNSQYSNLPFLKKRDMDKGFKDSAFRLNNDVKQFSKWTEKEILQRQRTLTSIFMKLWPMPKTNFEPIKKDVETASMDEEDYEFKGKKIQAYVFRGVRYTVNTWKEMLLQMCAHVWLENRPTIEWLCANEKSSFSNKPEVWYKEFSPGLFVWADNSTYSKINVLHGLFDECNIPYSELSFEFRPDEGDDNEDDE